MDNRLVSLALILGCMAVVTYLAPSDGSVEMQPTLVLGFLLLSAYCIGYFGERFRLPRITGYIMAGLLLGPAFGRFFAESAVVNLGFLNSLALAFIAFLAGGELRLRHIRRQIKSILALLAGSTLIVVVGVTGLVFAASGVVPVLAEHPVGVRLAVAGVIGAIAAARSPSSAIAIISETEAKGPFTDLVLVVTVAADVVVIVLFAVVISFSQILVDPHSDLGLVAIGVLLLEIGVAFVLGHLLGRGIIYLVQRLQVELSVILVGMGFFVIKVSHGLSDYLHSAHQLSFNFEPLLICMAAGFTVQNFSDQGDKFIHGMERLSLPIYVGFFAITGASIQLDMLRAGWLLGLMVVAARLAMLWVGSYVSSRAAGDAPLVYRNAWLGFVTQAGVSLGLVAEVVRRFPEVGVFVQTILIAAITVNQVIGPVAFKYVLGKVGESKAAAVG